MIILIILFLIIFVIPVIGLIIGFPFILLGAKRADKIKKERKVEEESRRGKELDERIRREKQAIREIIEEERNKNV